MKRHAPEIITNSQFIQLSVRFSSVCTDVYDLPALSSSFSAAHTDRIGSQRIFLDSYFVCGDLYGLHVPFGQPKTA